MPTRLRAAALLFSFWLAPLVGAQIPVQISAQTQAAEATRDELQHYKLTADKLSRYMQIMGDLLRAQRTNVRMREAIQIDFDRDTSPAQFEQRITSVPEVLAIVKQHGLEPHDFSLLNWTVIWADLCAVGKTAPTTADACASPPHINPANISFMRHHQSDFVALRSKYWPADDSTP
jgi:hypothetical protein